jgi:hypothetical protein
LLFFFRILGFISVLLHSFSYIQTVIQHWHAKGNHSATS